MPTIYRFGNAKIAMYPNDHNPPHFHLLTPDYAAMIALADLTILAGEAHRETYQLCREWAVAHIDELWAKWEELNG